MPEPAIEPPSDSPRGICPYDGSVPYQEDDDGPYCVYCHEPVTVADG